jgi:triosephosphate isomerase (TIM)
MRKKIVAGNWKMNKTFDEAEELLASIAENVDDHEFKCEIVVCPPALYLELASDFADESKMKVGAQNASNHESGAYTGEISASMLESMDIDYCIIGHSERRKYFGETDELLAEKVNALLDHNLQPIFCCGEVKEEREKNIHFDVVRNQLENGLFHLSADEFGNVVIAYEPVWAIGTGLTATPEQAQEMHAFIRKLVAEKYNGEIAENTTILYGGSCNAKNAAELFAKADVDGGLIGGASLKTDDFLTIAASF